MYENEETIRRKKWLAKNSLTYLQNSSNGIFSLWSVIWKIFSFDINKSSWTEIKFIALEIAYACGGILANSSSKINLAVDFEGIFKTNNIKKYYDELLWLQNLRSEVMLFNRHHLPCVTAWLCPFKNINRLLPKIAKKQYRFYRKLSLRFRIAVILIKGSDFLFLQEMRWTENLLMKIKKLHTRRLFYKRLDKNNYFKVGDIYIRSRFKNWTCSLSKSS